MPRVKKTAGAVGALCRRIRGAGPCSRALSGPPDPTAQSLLPRTRESRSRGAFEQIDLPRRHHGKKTGLPAIVSRPITKSVGHLPKAIG